MQQVFKQDEIGKFKEYLIDACVELEDEERVPGSSLWTKASVDWINNEQNCAALWNWFNSDSYEKLCEDWDKNYGKTIEIPNLGQWKIDFVLESGACIITKDEQKLEYWLWMVPDWNEIGD